jgi:hypothetical protein
LLEKVEDIFVDVPSQSDCRGATINPHSKAQENPMNVFPTNRPDEGMRKGAVEDDTQNPAGELHPQNNSLAGQLGHRDQDEMLKDNDTDFPGLDAEAEHTGK